MTGMVTTSILAMRRTRATSLKFYLLSEAVASAAFETILLAGGQGYVAAYLILRPVNFLTALWVAPPTLWGAFTAILLAGTTYLALDGQTSLYALVALLQGALYVLAGISAVNRQPILAILWMVLGFFNLGFAIGWQITAWAHLNQWWQAVMCCMAFSWLAFRLRLAPAGRYPGC